MASSRALCTLAGARLISSARMMLAKTGPFLVVKSPALRVVDQGADQVRRQQVRRELDAPERAVDRLGQRGDRERLGQPRHAFDQHVTVGEQRQQQALDEVFLSDQDFSNLGPQANEHGAFLLDPSGNLFDVNRQSFPPQTKVSCAL